MPSHTAVPIKGLPSLPFPHFKYYISRKTKAKVQLRLAQGLSLKIRGKTIYEMTYFTKTKIIKKIEK